MRKRRTQTRERRAKAGLPIVSLVGYTNAGKSTLLNTLTRSEVIAEDKLFATLDPTSRRIRFPQEREVVLTDTVGFIRRLPPDLKEAFRATLEELESADLLVLVCDASHPEVEEQVEAVRAILAEMDLDELPSVLVLNKWDKLDAEGARGHAQRLPRGHSRRGREAIHPGTRGGGRAQEDSLGKARGLTGHPFFGWPRSVVPMTKTASHAGKQVVGVFYSSDSFLGSVMVGHRPPRLAAHAPPTFLPS